jgi:release factor glutamine methyltransferase
MQTWINDGMTISASQTASPLGPLETRMLLSHAFNLSRVQLITQSELTLNAQQAQELNALIDRRWNGEPMAYILGEREFFGLSFYVTPDVLIPRPDTELLVELALQHAPKESRLLDLGTGSGAIAIAIAHQRPDLQVSAVDFSPEAVCIAEKNVDRLLPAKSLRVLQSDWYSALAGEQFDTIVGNPPYIVKDDRHLSQGDLRFEPIDALTDHADGLSNYRHIIHGAKTHLTMNGWLLLEHGFDQSLAVQELLTAQGFTEVQSWTDLSGILRVSGGKNSS